MKWIQMDAMVSLWRGEARGAVAHALVLGHLLDQLFGHCQDLPVFEPHCDHRVTRLVFAQLHSVRQVFLPSGRCLKCKAFAKALRLDVIKYKEPSLLQEIPLCRLSLRLHTTHPAHKGQELPQGYPHIRFIIDGLVLR